jgi:hypothetical protein
MVGSMVVVGQGGRGGQADARQLKEELDAVNRSLKATDMIRREHSHQVGRFRHDCNELVVVARKQLDDYFSHAASKVAIQANLTGTSDAFPPFLEGGVLPPPVIGGAPR